jgi:hypothetical protein
MPQMILLLVFLLFFSNFLIAGPPYDTDDPAPVNFRSWELYFSFHSSYYKTFAEGTLPHFEINYGVIKNVQLHMIVPLAFNNEYSGEYNYGIGDIEVGVKYRFIQETKYIPQIGIFPLCELPTGNSTIELGNGKAQFLIPVWIQKSFGDKWQTYGGYGYWINPGTGNQNWSFIGCQAQYQIVKKVSIGAEIYYTTPDTKEGESDTRFNIGSVIDINSQNHLLISAGRSFNDNTLLQFYVGYLFTISEKSSTAGIQNFKSTNNYVSKNTKHR